ncbi:LacI family DNA-binding transcriptional regulator [Novosphingobium sp.]|jgi:LacI family gluconate utilization system Gnt-I transcriptional repressor|uniref:LacI family DNA-binding transcriptional regulator n=1 Tax=Novosphingobium sp. TaxID=1874826 RepID=UPI001ED11816|nr:LacI family DNA-binding transcriptional regulator [Novosphingobium sp.]MBK6802235.1 LacI family DNA-binding transcriptional regulator [Novosphingobium sp.]MBK9009710.1 LacI family DNA-binding transcriptional regulator [Novosphingobium sp.]
MSENNGRNPTLDDVALHAGVSAATVSRYINNPKVVAAATGERIRAAIAATGYIPNLLAGGLASSKSKMVAVLIPHLTDSIFNDTIESMTGELAAAGFNVMLGLTGTGIGRTEDVVRAALSRRVDAIISTGPLDAELADLVRRGPALFIQIWELPEDPPGLAIGFSHNAAGRDVARFVLSRGYRRPHLVTANGTRAAMRRDAFKAEWQAQGGGAVTEAQVDIPSRFGHGRRVFADIRRMELLPDVVVCGSDYLAQGLIVEAQAAGLRVPDDIAVIGFGNSSVAGEMRPTITTVEIDGARIAREVLAAIRAHSAGEELPQRSVDVGFRLIARESA